MIRRARSRGYTVVELMMALGVFATGVTGIIAMQRTTVAANRHARSVVVATGIAQAWLDQLTADSSLWQSDLTQTTWLKSVDTAGLNGNWQLPAHVGDRDFGPRFDLFGNADDAADAYCAHIRLTRLYPGTPGVLRAEVRVFWVRDGGTRVDDDCTSAAAATIADVGVATDDYHFVYQAGAVGQRR